MALTVISSLQYSSEEAATGLLDASLEADGWSLARAVHGAVLRRQVRAIAGPGPAQVPQAKLVGAATPGRGARKAAALATGEAGRSGSHSGAAWKW